MITFVDSKNKDQEDQDVVMEVYLDIDEDGVTIRSKENDDYLVGIDSDGKVKLYSSVSTTGIPIDDEGKLFMKEEVS